jgi:integrase
MFGRSAAEPFTPTHVRTRALAAWTAENENRTQKAKEAGEKPRLLEAITLHECRHTYVSLMHAAGVPLERIGDYAGHSGTYMTERYRHLVEGQGAKDAAELDAFLTGAHSGARPRSETA